MISQHRRDRVAYHLVGTRSAQLEPGAISLIGDKRIVRRESLYQGTLARREPSLGPSTRELLADRPAMLRGEAAEPEVEVIRRQYTKSQLETAAYAERMHAELMSTLTRKQIGICLNRKLF